jgi:hypothetical protein
MYLQPGDGNLVAIHNTPDEDGIFDLDDCPPPHDIRHINPATPPPTPRPRPKSTVDT